MRHLGGTMRRQEKPQNEPANSSTDNKDTTNAAGRTQYLNQDMAVSTRILIWSLVISFIICWTPFHVYHIAVSLGLVTDLLSFEPIYTYSDNLQLTMFWCSNLDDAANCLAWLNAVVNPFLYAFVGKKFRANLFTLVKKWCGQTGGRESEPERLDQFSEPFSTNVTQSGGAATMSTTKMTSSSKE